MSPTPSPETVIIGAGPAGLAVGHYLRLRGIPFVILEKGHAPGHSWQQMPTNLALLSPWRANALPGTEVGWRERNELATRLEFAEYLAKYARERDMPIIYDADVASLSQENGRFVIRTSSGAEHRCRFVVNATGYFHNPYTPSFPGAGETNIPQIHSAAYKDPEQLQSSHGNRVRSALVVGKRITAGQIATELAQAGIRTSLSCRSPIEFARPEWLLRLAFEFYYFYENVRIRISPHFLEDSHPPMEAGETRRLIEKGIIRVRSNIERFEQDHVVFDDGTSDAFDLVIYATGFRPALSHIKGLLPGDVEPATRDFQVEGIPNLFFIGLDQNPTCRSRYLRGIREDARLLASTLAEAMSR